MRKRRLAGPLADAALHFTESVSFEWRLYRQISSAQSLTPARLLRLKSFPPRRGKIEAGLRGIEGEIERGEFKWHAALEDVHMNIEVALTRKIGAAKRKLEHR
jgi:argininosuccinate lyase